MRDSELYGPEFFEGQSEGSLLSAKVVVPLVCELLHPRSVVDVGCGRGTWLAVFREYGVAKVLGLDGDYVGRTSLLVPPECFRATDLRKPFTLDDEFDVAVCLEVAEHLPIRSAQGLVESLVGLAPAVLFSAAVPLQGGTNHVNEQWPKYWATLFAGFRYRRVDAIRPTIWKDRRVKWWYRQNTFLFVNETHVGSYPGLASASEPEEDLMLIHPDVFYQYAWLRNALKHLPSRIFKAGLNRLRG